MEFSINGNASGLSFYDNMLFVSVGGKPNRLVAFNTINGGESWHFDVPNSLGSVNVAPAVNDSLVLCGGQMVWVYMHWTGSVERKNGLSPSELFIQIIPSLTATGFTLLPKVSIV
jgi:hypothetical protein